MGKLLAIGYILITLLVTFLVVLMTTTWSVNVPRVLHTYHMILATGQDITITYDRCVPVTGGFGSPNPVIYCYDYEYSSSEPTSTFLISEFDVIK